MEGLETSVKRYRDVSSDQALFRDEAEPPSCREMDAFTDGPGRSARTVGLIHRNHCDLTVSLVPRTFWNTTCVDSTEAAGEDAPATKLGAVVAGRGSAAKRIGLRSTAKAT
jgi:hypothetical protein